MKIRILMLTALLALPAFTLAEDSPDFALPKPTLRAAKNLEANGNYAEALIVYGKLLDQYPDDRDLYRRLLHCRKLMMEKDLHDAVDVNPAAEDEKKILPDLPGVLPEEPQTAHL